ncbi:MAG: phosphoesterase [Methanomassiliicoccales archaeon]|nr:phosphoesterase [Methanomassiliicoccales archaeon]
MRVLPIADHPALGIEDGSTILCAGDLHIGIEEELKAKGIHVPSQTFRMEKELLSFRDRYSRLVLLGDIKHQVPGSTKQEYAEIPRFLRAMRRAFMNVDIVRGNHDSQIEGLVPEGIELHPSKGFVVDDIGFAHGHTWPSPQVMSRKTVVMAHNHPSVLFEEGLGNVTAERCWVRCRMKDNAHQRYNELPDEVIIVPALNRILGGSPINLKGRKLLGPLFSNDMVEVDEAEVYLIDGIYLGTVKNLTVQRSK